MSSSWEKVLVIIFILILTRVAIFSFDSDRCWWRWWWFLMLVVLVILATAGGCNIKPAYGWPGQKVM